jgi:DNA-binding beta-propeller fold protein YncE
VWVSRYNSFTNGTDDAQSMVVSPSGDTVFVTGWSDGVDTGYDYATVAYNATTGAQLWVSRYNGPAYGGGVDASDSAFSVAVSPGGNTVFVTGQKHGVHLGL